MYLKKIAYPVINSFNHKPSKIVFNIWWQTYTKYKEINLKILRNVFWEIKKTLSYKMLLLILMQVNWFCILSIFPPWKMDENTSKEKALFFSAAYKDEILVLWHYVL